MALPPGEFTRITTAFTSSSLASSLRSFTVLLPMMECSVLKALLLSSMISPKA